MKMGISYNPSENTIFNMGIRNSATSYIFGNQTDKMSVIVGIFYSVEWQISRS